jgi:hypothetical protein
MLQEIKTRTSIRSYLKKTLSEEDKQTVKTVLNETETLTGPFGHKARFFFVDNTPAGGEKIGTYGFVKHAPHFIGGVIKNTFDALVDYGFLFESVILDMTKHAFGTVWLGGTFKRSQFNINHDHDEIIPCVSPVGYSAKKSLRERVIRAGAKADSRKPFDTLFFLGDVSSPIPNEHKYYDYLEAVRVAPSASNKQPWRMIIDNDTFHVYLNRTKNYGKGLPFDIQAVDIGIGVQHLVRSLKADNHTVTYSQEDAKAIDDYHYVLSVHVTG